MGQQNQACRCRIAAEENRTDATLHESQPWSTGHIGTLVFLIFGLALSLYGYGKVFFDRK